MFSIVIVLKADPAAYFRKKHISANVGSWQELCMAKWLNHHALVDRYEISISQTTIDIPLT